MKHLETAAKTRLLTASGDTPYDVGSHIYREIASGKPKRSGNKDNEGAFMEIMSNNPEDNLSRFMGDPIKVVSKYDITWKYRGMFCRYVQASHSRGRFLVISKKQWTGDPGPEYNVGPN